MGCPSFRFGEHVKIIQMVVIERDNILIKSIDKLDIMHFTTMSRTSIICPSQGGDDAKSNEKSDITLGD